MLAIASGVLGASPASAIAVPQLSWSPPARVDSGQTPSAISCPSTELCVLVDQAGRRITSADPLAAEPSWQPPVSIDPGHGLTSVSCASVRTCVAVDDSGAALSSTEPTGSASAWQRLEIDGSTPLRGVSCPSTSLCVAVDDSGNALRSTDPTAKNPTWTTTPISSSALQSVSCATESLCVAVNSGGHALASTNPTAEHPTWTTTPISSSALQSVSCATESLCVAIDSNGLALASADAGAREPAQEPTWNQTEIDLGGVPSSLWCASSGLCLTVDHQGQALASANPTAALPNWARSSVASGVALTGVYCLAVGLCEAIDANGEVLRGLLPAPSAATQSASEIAAGTERITAAVDPNDTTLSGCRFEYGLGGAYELSVPCAAEPSATGGPQTVTANISNLAAASTYQYRIVASNAAGTTIGTGFTFTTAQVVSVPNPNPSIVGVPGVGERLRCLTGLPSNTTAKITYTWLHDASVIAGANSSSYQVRKSDARHHLQCRVTASNAAGKATASSPFVAVPAQGVIAAVGETSVGKVQVSASRVRVPVNCSSRAPSGCTILLRLSLRQRARSGHLVSVSVASLSAHLKQSQRSTLSLSLNTTGKRLLAHAHRLTVRLAVIGTVIGALKATLKTQTLTLRRSH